MKNRDVSIETLRGIAVILMVLGHVIYAGVTDENSWWRYFYYSLSYFRMPLFTAISGFVYALRPVEKDRLLAFMKGKSRRILIPFITVASLQYILHAVVPNVNTSVQLRDIWKIFIYSYGQFWFLQALFLVFVSVAILEYYGILTRLRNWLLTLFSSAFAYAIVFYFFENVTSNDSYHFYILIKYVYLLPYFILGIGLYRFQDRLYEKSEVLIAVSIVFILGIGIQQLIGFGILDTDNSDFWILGEVVGMTGIFLIFYLRKPSRFLAILGYYSYGIFLFHIFGTAGSRIIFMKLGVENLNLLFLLMMIFGLGFPIFLEEMLLTRNRLLKRVFLGLK